MAKHLHESFNGLSNIESCSLWTVIEHMELMQDVYPEQSDDLAKEILAAKILYDDGFDTFRFDGRKPLIGQMTGFISLNL